MADTRRIPPTVARAVRQPPITALIIVRQIEQRRGIPHRLATQRARIPRQVGGHMPSPHQPMPPPVLPVPPGSIPPRSGHRLLPVTDALPERGRAPGDADDMQSTVVMVTPEVALVACEADAPELPALIAPPEIVQADLRRRVERPVVRDARPLAPVLYRGAMYPRHQFASST